MARRDVSDARKGAYYLGSALIVVGFLLFISVFFSGFTHELQPGAGMPGFVMRAPLGMVLIIAGGVIRSIGARGAAGSGLVLDPQRARQDLEPWARMGGGMVSDALDEAGVDLGSSRGRSELPFDERLRRLHALHTDGILTDEEYEREKRELLESNG